MYIWSLGLVILIDRNHLAMKFRLGLFLKKGLNNFTGMVLELWSHFCKFCKHKFGYFHNFIVINISDSKTLRAPGPIHHLRNTYTDMVTPELIPHWLNLSTSHCLWHSIQKAWEVLYTGKYYECKTIEVQKGEWHNHKHPFEHDHCITVAVLQNSPIYRSPHFNHFKDHERVSFAPPSLRAYI